MKRTRSLGALILFISVLVSFFISFSTSSYAQRANLSGLKICLDPGHGGFDPCNDRRIDPDPGSGNIFWESEGNFRKALFLKPLLEARGATVYLTRTTNDSTTVYPDHPGSPCPDLNEPSLTARWQLANANNVNWFHSNHSNALGSVNSGTNYTLVLLKEVQATRKAQFPEALIMSDAIYRRIRERNRTTAFGVALDYTFYGGPNGGFNLGVLSGLVMPGELSEGSFHDYFPETRRLLNNDYRKNEAYGILNGFLEYYGVPFDSVGVIAGTQVDKTNGNKPVNNAVVRLLPLNKVYNGDTFNNGFFFFDSLPSGSYSVLFQTPGFPLDTVKVTIIGSTSPVSSTQPAANEIGVSRSKVISLTFINPMDTAKVRSAFSITPNIEGVIAWSNNNTVMTFTPKQLLYYKITYTLSLAGMGNWPAPLVFVDNKTVTSNVASTPFTLSFTSVTLPPVLTLTQPALNDTAFNVASSLGFRFSETMDTASVRSAFSIVPPVKASLIWTNSNTTLIFDPDGDLPFSTNYTATIGGTAKSIYGFFFDGNKDSVGGDQYVLTFRTMKSNLGVPALISSVPTEFSLLQNFPNPFNPRTEIQLGIPRAGEVTLTIFDMLGREVASLLHVRLNGGNYSISFDATHLPSGVYVYRLRTPEFTAARKMILTK